MIVAAGAPSRRAASWVTSSNTWSGRASAATSVAMRRSAPCCLGQRALRALALHELPQRPGAFGRQRGEHQRGDRRRWPGRAGSRAGWR